MPLTRRRLIPRIALLAAAGMALNLTVSTGASAQAAARIGQARPPDRALPGRRPVGTWWPAPWPSGSRTRWARVVVDNKPGAGGNLGADLAAKSAPDGQTIVMGAVATHAINPWLFKKLPYDPLRDFTPITLVAQVPNVLVLNADTATRLGINNLADLVAYARKNPGKLNYGSGRQWQRRPPGGRDVQGPGRALHGAHPVCRRQPRAAGPVSRPGGPELRQPGQRVGQHQGRAG